MTAWASLVKLGATELRQDIANVAASILGVEATTAGPGAGACDPFGGDVPARWAHELLESRAATIYAGTSEVQRNIIAEAGLGLPR